MGARILPEQLVQEVERYVESELTDADRYDNREPLDESGVWSLHALASSMYVRGWEDGERAQAERARGQQRRDERREIANRPIGRAELERLVGAAQDVLAVTGAATDQGQARTDAEHGALAELREALEAAGYTPPAAE